MFVHQSLKNVEPMIDVFLSAWDLTRDGELVTTPRSQLLPVRAGDKAAMLKMSSDPQERVGGALLAWWSGDGAARVLARDGDAILLERAAGSRSLADMSRSGEDAQACRVLCWVAERLRQPRREPPPQLTPLDVRFRDLGPMASREGGILTRCAAAARRLLCGPRDIAVLHGDLHHGNVLDFAERGWLAIDPKGLLGERGFEYANLFCNPDLSDPTQPVATLPDVFAARLTLVSELAGLERSRLITWILAWAGLSATWVIQAGQTPLTSLAIARMAAAELDR